MNNTTQYKIDKKEQTKTDDFSRKNINRVSKKLKSAKEKQK